MIIFLTVF